MTETKVFDTKGGANPEAARLFVQKLWELVAAQETAESYGFDIEITLDNKYTLKAYDQAALVQELANAIEYYADEIS